MSEPPAPRVFVSGRLPAPAMERLADLDLGWWEGDNLSRERLLEEAARAQGLLTFLTDRVDEELLAAAGRLKIVANLAVGFDNFDLAAATRHGVLLTNTPDVLTEATADLAFGLLIAAARRFREGRDWLEGGHWQGWRPLLLAGQEVGGTTLGIVGLGRIGRAVARRARGFGMRILYTGRARHPEAEDETGAVFVSLGELLGQADFVSLHCPLTAATHHLIGAAELARMKPTAVLVNTSRGAVVDQAALLEALRAGRIFAAGLDVFEEEPIALGDPLLGLPNVVALPHLGSATVATRTRMALRAVENLRAGLAGVRPRDLLNPEAWRG
ncbi:MAG: D-glycerate dehydrogenase [Thermaerobacter sp.]|nr:D-glycerate dehydrogenase [Thermaerobacter sp.]